MLTELTAGTIARIKNKSLVDYSQIYSSIKSQTLETIESFGLPLEQENDYRRNKITELKNCGALVRNNEKSIVSNGKISSACEACQTGTGSYTSFVSLNCHRDCYFCFNKNQDNYQFYLKNKKNVNQELTDLLASGVKLKHLALTGGEPLLHKEEAIDFFRKADELTPETYTRLYTAGDLLDEETLQSFNKYHLDEIRFSIKMEDSSQKQKHILGKIALAKQYIPRVMVEMPVIPGTKEAMKELILELEELEIFGINLLEFCFPLENPQPFREKGFKLKNPPYEIFYNYWYAGGLAVAESEQICLELVEFAIENKLNLGVHYCSLENKFTGQIYQQNIDHTIGELYTFSERDYFLKTAKAFGKDQRKVKELLDQQEISYEFNADFDYIQFPIDAIKYFGKKNIDLIISSNVIEQGKEGTQIREVDIAWTTPALFEEQDI
ncbi:radical SAM protein [Bacillus sp. B15-48]|uniref:radical SAM protein n=1 Tax=Bacillus sp. B15-48 TaxID=1548601 RepID=UPI00193FAF96|nr:radical SAM protein [Bacillus sp. B15-48]MBM4761288.1 radical SAM protein [Bacillus sp. B15-48]